MDTCTTDALREWLNTYGVDGEPPDAKPGDVLVVAMHDVGACVVQIGQDFDGATIVLAPERGDWLPVAWILRHAPLPLPAYVAEVSAEANAETERLRAQLDRARAAVRGILEYVQGTGPRPDVPEIRAVLWGADPGEPTDAYNFTARILLGLK